MMKTGIRLLLLSIFILLINIPISFAYSINEPGFETVSSWTYSESDSGDNGLTGGQSTSYPTEGTYSYRLTKISAEGAQYEWNAVTQANVNFTNMRRLVFDVTMFYAPTCYDFDLEVWIDTTMIGSYSNCNGASGTHSIDVTSFSGLHSLKFKQYLPTTTLSSGWSIYLDNIRFNLVPSIPVLVSHNNYHTTEITSVNWSISSDGDSDSITYDIKVGTTSGGTDILNYNGDTDTTSNSFTQTVSNTYYWSVRACDSYECSAWATESSFTFYNNVSSIPNITSPLNNSRQYNNSINLTWNQSTDADGDSITYHNQLSNQSNFGYIINQSNISNNWTRNIATTDGVTYYSRVRSYDSYEYSNWSNIVQFTENTKPSYTNITLNPASPTITDNLTISYSLTDANLDTVTNYTRWYKNNVLQSPLNNLLYVNATGNTSYGETWRYEIFGNDTYENSTAESSNEVIIGSTNSYPSFTSLVLTPNSKKYNKTININASGISDDNTTWQVQTYYLINGSTKVYLVNSSWITTTYANLTATIPWSDGGLHTIYALVYDSGNATGVENLSSSPIPATFTSLITAPTLVNSSIDDATINTGGSVIISSQVDGVGANVTWVKALVRRPDATSANWTMSCGTGENVSCTYTYTSTSDVGNYYVDYFYILDDSGNLGEIAPDTTLNFYASTPVVPPSGGGGGSPIPKATPKANLSDVVLQIKKISPELPSGITELIAECYTKDVLLEGKCATINLSEPMNWWPLLGAYIASFFTIFGIAIITRKPRNLIVDGLLYGTIAIVIIQLIVIMGFNAYFMSYLMQSDLPAFMFVSVVA